MAPMPPQQQQVVVVQAGTLSGLNVLVSVCVCVCREGEGEHVKGGWFGEGGGAF